MLDKAVVAGLLAVAVVAPAMAQPASSATAAGSQAAALAGEVVQLTFQPQRARTDALASFERNFLASFERSEQGRAVLAARPAAVTAMRDAGVQELSRALDNELIPDMTRRLTADYVATFSSDELRQLRDFWSSPAGRRLTASFQSAAVGGGAVPAAIVVPEKDRRAVATFQSTDAGRKEAELTARAGPLVMASFGESLTRLMPRIQAKIQEAAKRAAPQARTQ